MLQLGTKLSYLVSVTDELCKFVLVVDSTDATEEYKLWSMLIERKVILRFIDTDFNRKDAIIQVEISCFDSEERNDSSGVT